MSQKIALVTDGTWGDVLPFIFLGKELVARGHRVKIFCNEYYKTYCEEQGLKHITTTPRTMRTRMLANKDLWHPWKSMKTIGKDVEDIFCTSLGIIDKGIQQADVVVGHSFTYAARTAAEMNNVHYVSLLISPIQARTLERLPVFFGGINPNILPVFFKKYFYYFGDRLFLDRLFGKKINEIRKEYNLPPITSFVHWGTSPDTAIGLWPEWYASVCDDQKSFLQLAGFTHAVEMGVLDRDLVAWIHRGSAPIVLTLGSGYRFIKSWKKVLENIVEETGHRCIVLGPHSEQDTDTIIYRTSVSLREILPLTALCIHHGGAGMVTQSIVAGVPSLVVPMAHDQPDNAHLMKVHSLAEIIWMRKPSVKKVVPQVVEILNAEHSERIVKKRSEEVLKEKDGIKKAADILEKVLKKNTSKE